MSLSQPNTILSPNSSTTLSPPPPPSSPSSPSSSLSPASPSASECSSLLNCPLNHEEQEGVMHILKKYGKVGIVTHLAISWTIFAGLYIAVGKTGQGPRLVKFLKLENRIPSGAGNFAISGLMYKVTMPVRVAISLVAIPFVAQYTNFGQPEKPTSITTTTTATTTTTTTTAQTPTTTTTTTPATASSSPLLK